MRSPDGRAYDAAFQAVGFRWSGVGVGCGWSYREVAFAATGPTTSSRATINLDQVQMNSFSDKGEAVGKNGVYIAGDTPASTKFVTGRFMLQPGKSPHAPHTHAEEEVMIIESGTAKSSATARPRKSDPAR